MVERFVSEKLERDVKSFLTTDEMYSAYSAFCGENDQEPLTKIKFNNRLKHQGICIKHKKMVNRIILSGWQGARFK